MTETKGRYEAGNPPPPRARLDLEISPVEEQVLEAIQSYYRYKTIGETVSRLINQEARKLARGGQPLMAARDIVGGYLGGVVTAEEAMQALSVHDDLLPVDW